MKPLSILFFSHADHSFPKISGGAIRYVQLFPLWKQLGAPVSLIDNSFLFQGEFFRRLSKAYPDIKVLCFPYLSFLPYYFRFVYHLIFSSLIGLPASFKHDIIYSDFTPLQLLPAAFCSIISRKKLVVAVQLYDTAANNLQYRVLKYLLRFSSLVLCCNPYYQRFFPHENAVVTQYAISSEFRPLSRCPKIYGLYFNGHVDDNRKGIAEYVDTATKLYRQGIIKKALIVTTSSNMDYLNSLHLQPQVFDIKKNLSPSEVARCLNQSQVFLFPTHAESYGLAIGEALRCGVPVVLSQIPEMKIWSGLAVQTSSYYQETLKLLKKPRPVPLSHPLLSISWESIAKHDLGYMKKLI